MQSHQLRMEACTVCVRPGKLDLLFASATYSICVRAGGHYSLLAYAIRFLACIYSWTTPTPRHFPSGSEATPRQMIILKLKLKRYKTEHALGPQLLQELGLELRI